MRILANLTSCRTKRWIKNTFLCHFRKGSFDHFGSDEPRINTGETVERSRGDINHENTFDNGVSAWEALNDEGYNSKHVSSNLKGAFSSIRPYFSCQQ